MNKQDEKYKPKSVEEIRQGKRVRIEKEKTEKQITDSEKQRTVTGENQCHGTRKMANAYPCKIVASRCINAIRISA